MDTFNQFLVGVRADKIHIMSPPKREITKDEALMLAAWLVVLADDDEKFPSILEAVQNT